MYVIAWLEFESVYYDVTALHVNDYITGSPLYIFMQLNLFFFFWWGGAQLYNIYENAF